MSNATVAASPRAESAAPLLRRAAGGTGRWRGWALRLVVLMLLVAAVLWVRKAWFSDLARPHPRVQRITLVASQRPPPPKPPDRLPDPPREIETRGEALIAPPNADKAEPVNDALGVDADGQGAGDGFGLVGRRGGRDITTIGDKPGERASTGVASGLAAMNHMAYAGLVLQRLRVELAADARLVSHDYVAVVHLWIDSQGRIVRYELPTGSGQASTDSALRDAFANAPRLPEPPAGLPQPIRLRVTSAEVQAGALK